MKSEWRGSASGFEMRVDEDCAHHEEPGAAACGGAGVEEALESGLNGGLFGERRGHVFRRRGA